MEEVRLYTAYKISFKRGGNTYANQMHQLYMQYKALDTLDDFQILTDFKTVGDRIHKESN